MVIMSGVRLRTKLPGREADAAQPFWRGTGTADADLMLGYMTPTASSAARSGCASALERQVAKPLGITVTEAAWESKRLIEGIMGQEMCRICSLMSGRDPRDFCAEAYAMRDFQRLLAGRRIAGPSRAGVPA
jgi:hypothetical protein